MEIEKLKLNQTMRKEAVISAAKATFGKRVEKLNAEIRKVFETYVVSRPVSKKLQAEYENASDNMKKLINVTNVVSFQYRDEKKNVYDLHLNVLTYGLKFLSSHGKDEVHIFDDTNSSWKYTSKCSITLGKRMPLLDTVIYFEKGKFPAAIQKVLDKRDLLMKEVVKFATDMYHALVHIKNIKEVRQHLPAIEKFLDIPEKQFTQMVPHTFFNRVNKSVMTKG